MREPPFKTQKVFTDPSIQELISQDTLVLRTEISEPQTPQILEPLKFLSDRVENLSPNPKIVNIKLKSIDLPALTNPVGTGFTGYKNKVKPIENRSKLNLKP